MSEIHWQRHLPEKFEFYHLGEVAANPQLTVVSGLKNKNGILFTLVGDLEAWFLLVVDEKQEISMYAEVGNILIGDIIASLNQPPGGGDFILSPPQYLSESKLETVYNKAKCAMTQVYQHVYNNQSVPFEFRIYLSPSTIGAEV